MSYVDFAITRERLGAAAVGWQTQCETELIVGVKPPAICGVG